MFIRGMRKAIAVAALYALAGLHPAVADTKWYPMEFQFANQLSVNITAKVSQYKYKDVAPGYIQWIQTSVKTTGVEYTMETYNIDVTEKANPAKTYCRFTAEVEYKGVLGWACSVHTDSSSGAKCQSSRDKSSTTMACSFDFKIKKK